MACSRVLDQYTRVTAMTTAELCYAMRCSAKNHALMQPLFTSLIHVQFQTVAHSRRPKYRVARKKLCYWTTTQSHLSWSKSNWIYIFSERTFINMYTEIQVDITTLTNLLSKIVLHVKIHKNHRILSQLLGALTRVLLQLCWIILVPILVCDCW